MVKSDEHLGNVDSAEPADSGHPEPESGSGLVLNRRPPEGIGGDKQISILFAYCLLPCLLPIHMHRLLHICVIALVVPESDELCRTARTWR